MCKEKTEFVRLCPSCGKELYYKSINNLNSGIDKKSWCRGCNLNKKLSLEELHERNVKNQLGRHNKGKTYEEIHGEEKAKQIKRKISEFPSKVKGQRSKLKGRTYEDIFGVEGAKKRRKQTSKANKGRTFKDRQKTYVELHGPEKAEEIKRKQRVHSLNRIREQYNNGGQLQPFYNPDACNYFDWIMEQTGTFIQHAQNGGEFECKYLGYFADGYDSENNIWYEWDEKQHFNFDGTYIDYDIKRQHAIESFLNCIFIRIKDFKS